MSQIQVRDKFNNPLPLIDVRVAVGHRSTDEAYDDKRTDNDGNTAFPVVLPSNEGYTLWFNTRNVNKDFDEFNFFVDRIDAQDIVIHLERTIRERASIFGFYSNVFFKGESAFLDLCRLCHGQDIKPLLQQSIDLGSNGRRNFFMTFNTAQAAGLPPFNPDNFIGYYDKVEELLSLYMDYGIYLYSSIFPDNQLFPSWNGNTNKQKDHWNKLGSIAQRYSNWWGMELTNEPFAHSFNRVDVNQFSKISNVICCSGSFGDTGGSPMPEPQWDVCDYHSPRFYPNEVVDMCVANHPSRVQKSKAILLGEPQGFGPGREQRPRVAKEMAGSSRGTACGVVFHSTHGPFSQTYDQVELDCAKAFFNELKGT